MCISVSTVLHVCSSFTSRCRKFSESARSVAFDVVLSQVVPELRRQRKAFHALVGGAAADQRPAQVLEGEREGSRQRAGEERLKEEARGRVTVVSQQPRHAAVLVHARVVHVKAESLVVLLDACVQGAAVAAKADREEVLVLGGVSQQKRALRFALKELLRLEAVQDTPVARAVADLEQVRNQDVVSAVAASLRAPVWTRRVPVLQAGASTPRGAADVIPGQGGLWRGGGGGRDARFERSLRVFHRVGVGGVLFYEVPASCHFRFGGERALVLHEF